MSGYGSHKWTCGECGDSYEATGVCGDLQVDRWMREHREMHRVEKMPAEERAKYEENKMRVWSEMRTVRGLSKAMARAQGTGEPS